MEPPNDRTRVLVVEDEIVVSEDLQQRLKALGFDVAGAADAATDAIQLAASVRPDVVLMDIMLHGRPDGIDAAEQVRGPLDIPVIFLTAHSDPATLQRAKLTDPAGYIVKPFDDEQLRVAIELAPHRHQMERKARSVARWLSATFTSIGDPVIATNTRGEILLLNPAAEKLTGWTQEDACGKPCGEVVRLVNAATRQPLEDPATRALRLGLVVRLDPGTLLIARTGEEHSVDDSASPITDEAGKVLGAVVVLVGATTRGRACDRERALSRQVAQLLAEREKLDALGAELQGFVAAVSHDLRTPLNALVGFSELLALKHSDRLNDSGKLFLKRVRQSAQQIRLMVDDYLRFLISTRDQPLKFDPVDMRQLVQECYHELATVPGQAGASLVCDALPQAWGDPAMLRPVLCNLLGNAVKYSAKREHPTVEVGALPGDDFHTFFVRDNGAGLDIAQATKLFEPFQRFHSVAEFPGTGVGLTIVKRLVERHGGRVWAESRPGEGATFFFTLPARVSDTEARLRGPSMTVG
jgi:hypothetical protein